jgi:hypothetical protein
MRSLPASLTAVSVFLREGFLCCGGRSSYALPLNQATFRSQEHDMSFSFVLAMFILPAVIILTAFWLAFQTSEGRRR